MHHLSHSQRYLLALWSYGLVLAKTSGQSKVVAALAGALQEKEDNLRQRMREWLWDKADKKGQRRTDWNVEMSFAPLLGWVLSLWPEGDRRLSLALDATTLKDVFLILVISVVYQGTAIPIAWAILPANQKNAWKGHWLRLLARLRGSTPADWQVIVLADRGLYARWLFQAIQACHWHPFLRINLGGTYCSKGRAQFLPLKQLLPKPGAVWQGQVTCFQNHPLTCTLLATWGPSCKEPWLILTDLLPEQASAAWYGMRSWIEDGFKDLKRDGWLWHKTRMTDPIRAERFWLVLAVATLWVVNVGGQAHADLPLARPDRLPPTHPAVRSKILPAPPRRLSFFSRGLIALWINLLHHLPIVLHPFSPAPWPLETYP